ncbi:MAG: BatD family protein, partial [Paludibacteraceae bacterium]|nr:BatD family protein [Paludibacteraceae bacterium]
TQQQNQGQVSQSQSITNENLFLRTIVSRSKVYEQEVVLVTYKIYTRVDLVNITNVKFPDFKGFLMQEIDLPKDKQFSLENYNGKNYNTITLRQVLLYPQRSGKIDIEKMTCDAIVRLRNTSSRPRSIFDDFFDSYQEVQKPLVAPSKTIEVDALPTNKPASFTGAVGVLKMTSSISQKEMSVNEPVTIKLKISGNGNLKLIKAPEIRFPSDFEVYEPKVENSFTNTTSGVSGSKTIEYLAIPRFGGTYTIPSIKFSYFDVNEKKYVTLSTEEYVLNVQKSEGESSGEQSVVINNFSNKENVKMLGSDIRHIYTSKIDVKPSKRLYFGSFLFWLSYILPLIVVIFVFLFFRKLAIENANVALVRNKKANKIARKRLRQAEKFLKENKKEEFYNEILKALWGYLCDKLAIPQSELNKDNLEIELQKQNLSPEIINSFIALLNECEFAQYAFGESLQDRDKLFEETTKIIMLLEENIKK